MSLLIKQPARLQNMVDVKPALVRRVWSRTLEMNAQQGRNAQGHSAALHS